MTLATVHGSLPTGARLEFLAPGSTDRQIAKSNSKGLYSITLPPGRYEVTLISASGKRVPAMYNVSGAGAEMNAQPEEKSKSSASGQEYDLLADWHVVDSAKKGIGPVKVTLEAELTNGRTEKLSLWALSGLGDEEKPAEGMFQTDTPDGRVQFRVREARLNAERVAALRVKVEVAGHPAVERRVVPVLEFSSSGHFHSIYPESYEMIVP